MVVEEVRMRMARRRQGSVYSLDALAHARSRIRHIVHNFIRSH